MTAAATPLDVEFDAKRDRLVVAASSLGTVFEWYDFFVYGTLAPVIARLFFPSVSPTAGFLWALAAFGAGFGVRPVGAVLFGYLGDRWGRKYTFLITITLMGVATAAVGLLPTYAQAGLLAPALLVALRLLQGLALGGEYGGAAIYVAEHAPANRRGFYTSFIQASVVGGFLLSLIVVLGTEAVISSSARETWGWRVPFLLSLLLLAISLWIRLKLRESPVFQAMKDAGKISGNPLKESFTHPGNTKRIIVALFGISAGLTVVWYTAQFQALYFLQNSQHVDDDAARLIVGIGAIFSCGWFILFGWLSDRIGRKPPIVVGYVLTLLLLFPLFHIMAGQANPGLSQAGKRETVLVSGPDCTYNPFARSQATPCGEVLDYLSKNGIAYTKDVTPGLAVTVGGRPIANPTPAMLDKALVAARYNTGKIVPTFGRGAMMVLCIVLIGFLSGMTYGPVAALLVELFPARIRYSSMSIPYHLGTGYFGGFLPFISQYIIAKTGDPFSGLWYTFVVVAVALVITVLWLPETAGRELD